MHTRLLGLPAALAAFAVTAGCGLTGTEPGEASPQSAKITVGGDTRDMKSVSCTQIQWILTIEADADPGSARAFLRLGGETPVVRTVNIENIDNTYGVVGGDLGNAEASADGGTYTITGTAVGSDRANPGQTREVPFKIEAPC